MATHLFTSESVSEGHPDKIADQISDAILDYFLSKDSQARVAVETLVTTNKIVLAGEVKTSFSYSHDDINKIALQVVKEIGYEQAGFDHRKINVSNYIHSQSPDIAIGVDEAEGKEEGAGDQGIMFGYACDETEEYMPFAIGYAHKLLHFLSEGRKSGKFKGLLPDAKSQITVEYKNKALSKIHTVVVSHQHEESLTKKEVDEYVMYAINAVLPKHLYNPKTCIHHINPTGRFVIGGPDGDAGLTGRKIIVDTYGGSAPHGGGAFSGKDPTKVDRSAAYAARYIAKNLVAAGIAKNCTVQLSYAIGVSKPTSIYVDTHGSSKIDNKKIISFLHENLDLSPKGIRQKLCLNNPIYRKTATYGHFGRSVCKNGTFSWERLDLVDDIKKYFFI